MLPTIKKKCKACGNVVIVKRNMVAIDKAGVTPAPESCATCRSLGVEKAIEQRLMSGRKSSKTEFKIKSKRVRGLKEIQKG